MRRLLRLLVLVLLLASAAAAQKTPPAPPKPAALPDATQLEKMAARFAPTELRVDTSALAEGDQKALVKLIEAARVIDDIFMSQLWSGNHALHEKLQRDATPLGRARLHYFWINKGPWSDLDAHKAFLSGVPARKPKGANFYPEDMTAQEFEAWVKTLNDTEREHATSYFTIIRREKGTRKLVYFPYSVEYRGELAHAARLLDDAAQLTSNATLRKFLHARADAFISNEYRASDMGWMDLDGPLDVTIGPYETYNDELFGYKAAFEAYINLRDDQETAKVGYFSTRLQEIENNLPEDAKYRNAKLGSLSPIRVVNEVFSAGDGNHGVQTAAYNLPNDEQVVKEKGSKRVMLKNVQEAKFNSTLLPIAQRLLPAEARADVSFPPFFTHILAHELTHGLGPHQIKVKGRDSTPRLELKELYSAIEEAKADVTGLFALQYLLDHSKGKPDPALQGITEKNLYATFLASSFRSIRFGTSEAHGKGQAVQFNYFLDKGAFVARPDGTFAVDLSKIRQAVRDLDHELLTLEATGDYAGAKRLLDRLGVVRPAVKKALDRLAEVPVDIEPRFVTADAIAPPAAGNPNRHHRHKGRGED